MSVDLDQEYWTAEEVMRRFKIGRTWLYAAVREGRIPHVRLGASNGPLRFPVRELAEWLEQNQCRPER